jgi:hypothetical protein
MRVVIAVGGDAMTGADGLRFAPAGGTSVITSLARIADALESDVETIVTADAPRRIPLASAP